MMKCSVITILVLVSHERYTGSQYVGQKILSCERYTKVNSNLPPHRHCSREVTAGKSLKFELGKQAIIHYLSLFASKKWGRVLNYMAACWHEWDSSDHTKFKERKYF